MVELSIPSVRSDQRVAGEFRPRKLETWLSRLPRTDYEGCLKQLDRALATQNRVTLEPAMRLQLMELYLAPFRELHALHHSDMRTLSRVPLHPHYRARQERMLGTLDAMANGYKIVVVDLAPDPRGAEGELALALQRSMYCLAEALVTVYELYMRPPTGAWRELHELYRCAEGADLAGHPVAPLPGYSEQTDVLKTYVPILLLGATSPHGLLAGEARRLYELAPQWQRSARISEPAELPAEPGHYRFELDADAPPFPVSKSTRPVEPATRVLKTLGVARAMHQVLTDLNDAATQRAVRKVLGPAGIEPTDVELFRRAGRVFGEVGIRRASNRFSAGQRVALQPGFDAAYYACNHGRPFEPAAPVGAPLPESSTDEPGEQFIDLSDPMLGAPIKTQPAAEPAGDRYTPLQPRAFNQSAGGLGLTLARTDDLRLKVGDIAACRYAGAPGWQLGVVRWLRTGSKETRFGLQFLGPVAEPATAAPAGAPGAPAVPAIWLPENPALKQANSLVLPRATEPYPAVLEVRRGANAPERVSLLRRVGRTGDYEQFLVSLESAASGSGSHSDLSS